MPDKPLVFSEITISHGKLYSDTDLTFSEITTSPKMLNYHVPPGGYLTEILVQKLTSARVNFRITLAFCDEKDPPICAQFTVPRELWRTGYRLPVPVANLNSAFPWVLQLPEEAPKLRIITVSQMNRASSWTTQT